MEDKDFTGYPDIIAHFTVVIVPKEGYGQALYDWFNNSFSKIYGDAQVDFDLTFQTDHEGIEVLEICQHNPDFSVNSLIEMFRQRNKAHIIEKSVIPMKPGFN